MSNADEMEDLKAVVETLRRKLESTALCVEELALIRDAGITYPKTTVGEQACLDGRTPGMEVLRRHLRDGFWPPTAWRLVATGEREMLGLSPREDVLAHVMFIPVGTGLTVRTSYFRNPGDAIKNTLKLVGEGALAPSIHDLKAMALLPAGGQVILQNEDSPAWD
jgi:hypothetical protein